jgi:hypothetical protein
MRDILLALHIAAGSLGLVLGSLAMLAPKRPGRHARLGLAYQASTAVLCLTAFVLVAYRPEFWWLGVIAAATWAAALCGWWMARHQPHGWVQWHLNLMCSSYISFVTALLVVNLGLKSLIAWTLPTLIGAPLIARANVRIASRNATDTQPTAEPRSPARRGE